MLMPKSESFLPVCRMEMQQRGWDQPDIILITGDAYIDHPSFGAALIGRYMESLGYRVGILAQPDWRGDNDFQALGRPRLFFGITAGNMDSMISNMTSEKRRRKTDAYSEGGFTGKRPDRATIVYCNKIRQLYPGVPIVIGGLEASLRRLAHYDYWDDRIRRSILFDSRADILVYGMAERAVAQIARRLNAAETLEGIPNTARIVSSKPHDEGMVELPSYEDLLKEKSALITATLRYEHELALKNPERVIQPCENRYILLEPPRSLSADELGMLYTDLPFTRKAHPKYQLPVPANGFVKDSIVSHRGCYGGCSFCALTVHQGKYITSRSELSIVKEAQIIASSDEFKGTIQDVGGPSANMYGSNCKREQGCARLSCLYPRPCPNLHHDQHRIADLLGKIEHVDGVKHLFINSGIRYDLALQSSEYLEKVVKDHVSGQLSVAPEHLSSAVLDLMQKPSFREYENFCRQFDSLNRKHHKKQYMIPYFIAAHPGSTLQDMYELAVYLRKNRLRIQQVQTFVPVPMTLSCAMYYAEINPFNFESIHVAKGEERLLQRALLQPSLKSNLKDLRKALSRLGKLSELGYLSGSGNSRENIC